MINHNLQLARVICAFCFLINNVIAYAESDAICSAASIINPLTIDGGMGGTSSPANGGFGGTGISTEHGGAGGTGISAGHGGMGGTGDSISQNELLPEIGEGGIVIVGVVTGFASICVDGVEVHYSSNTPVFDNGRSAKLGHLAAGKMVMLKADRVAGQLQARAIGMFDAVAGPIVRVDVGRQQIQVIGQTVRVDQNTMQQLRDISMGTDVRVSGHRLENGEIVATRVDVAKSVGAANTISSVNTLGLITSISRDGMVVDGTSVNVANIKMLDKLSVGSEIRVAGTWDGKAIKADHVEVQPIKNMINRSDAAIVEGFLGSRGSNKFKLYGTELQFSQSKNGDKGLNESKIVKIEMRRETNGNWVADKVEVRKGKLFEKNIQFKNEMDYDRGGSSSKGESSSKGGGDGRSGEVKPDHHDSGSNSGSGSRSGSSGVSGSSGRSSGGGGSSSNSGVSGRSGSGKYK